MGSQKLVLPYNESTIIETVIDNVLSSKIDHVMVVLGADSEMVKATIGDRNVDFYYNKDHEEGMLSSVMSGINSLPEDAGTALIFLGDQPGILPSVTNAIIDAYNDSLHGIVIPVYNHRRGHPLLVDMVYRKEIARLDLEQGLRALRHLFPEDVLEVEVDEPGILVDINTQEDYSKAIKPDR